jgi:hypothetical protein
MDLNRHGGRSFASDNTPQMAQDCCAAKCLSCFPIGNGPTLCCPPLSSDTCVRTMLARKTPTIAICAVGALVLTLTVFRYSDLEAHSSYTHICSPDISFQGLTQWIIVPFRTMYSRLCGSQALISASSLRAGRLLQDGCCCDAVLE